MTIRSVVFGFIGAALICGLTYFNDFVLHQTFLVGNHFPLSVYGTLLIFIVINLGIFKLNKRLALTGKEFAVIIGMTLVSCCIPSSGLMRLLPVSMLMPQHHNKVRPGWQRSRVVDELTPRGMMVDIWRPTATGTVASAEGDRVTFAEMACDPDTLTQMKIRITSGTAKGQVRRVVGFDPETKTASLDGPWMFVPAADAGVEFLTNVEAEVLTPYLQGQQNTTEDAPVGGVFKNSIIPWAAWLPPLKFWIPLIVAFWVAVMGMSLLVHRQWADHEHLPYPISAIASSLLPGEGKGISAVVKDRRFQIAFGVVFIIYMSNYVAAWFPDYWPEIPRHLNFGPIVHHLKLKESWYLRYPKIYLTVIAIAYFLASDVSLSLGLSGVISSVVFGTVLVGYGINWTDGDAGKMRNQHFLVFGAFLGVACMILYTGRHYYLNVLKKSVGLKTEEKLPGSGILGMRVMMVGVIAVVCMLLSVGVALPMAIIYTGAVMMMYLVMGRIIAETGLFFIQNSVIPSAVIIGLVGIETVGPKMTLTLFLVCMIFTLDPRECLMPFVMNSLRLLDLQKVSVNRAVGWLGASLILGLAVAIPTTLYFQYKHGVASMNGWSTNFVPTCPQENTIKLRSRLEAKDTLEEAMTRSTSQRIAKIKPMRMEYLAWLAVGLALALGFSVCRLRFSKWPFHPIMFLIILSYSIRCFWFSFLLGWLIKTAVTRFGGSKVYHDLKPVVIGLVAGEMLGALIPVIYGTIHYFVSGEMPMSFSVFPR